MAKSRLDKLRSRRMDPLVKVAGLREAYDQLVDEDSSVRYAIGAMQPIDQDYTLRTLDERNRVEKQLAEGYGAAGLDMQFDYQGSLTNDTHVRIYSDVDLLTIIWGWHGIEPPNKPTNPYLGDPIQDLRHIRQMTIAILRAAYPAATVDQSKGKCVSISGGSLKRHIDLIASDWWYTVEYVQSPAKDKHWLGIEILDDKKGERVPNKPFLHNKRIAERDAETNGGLRKAIRLLKSLKYDSDDKIEVSSYDLASIAYNIFTSWLTVPRGQDLLLVSNCRDYLRYLLYDASYRASIEVPNKMRNVFCAGGATEAGLGQLSLALDTLVAEIDGELGRSLRKLKEARILY